MKYKYIDYKEMLQRLAIQCFCTDYEDIELWTKTIRILVCFYELEAPEVRKEYIEKLKKHCDYLPANYFYIVDKYDCFAIGNISFWGIGILMENDQFNEPYISSGWQIGRYDTGKTTASDFVSGRLCVHESGSVCLLPDTESENAELIANSFSEFMEDCVFGERYLEFNGHNEDDETYKYIKRTRQSLESGYAELSEQERLNIRKDIEEQEAYIIGGIEFDRALIRAIGKPFSDVTDDEIPEWLKADKWYVNRRLFLNKHENTSS